MNNYGTRILKNSPLCAYGFYISLREQGAKWNDIYQTQTFRNGVEVAENSLCFIIYSLFFKTIIM